MQRMGLSEGPRIVQPRHEVDPPLLLSLHRRWCGFVAGRPDSLGGNPSSFTEQTVTSGNLFNFSEPLCFHL